MKLASKVKKGISKMLSKREFSDSMSIFANDLGCCGLVKILKGEDQEDKELPTTSPVPLVSVDVNASVVHTVAQVQVTQVYVNKESQPIEAIYYFPVNPDGAVTHFQAELEGRLIKGVVKGAEEAEEAYRKAVENRTTAFLGDASKADIFKVRVGFLKPGSQVRVVIGYVTEVKNEPGTNLIRFYIPTTVAPRYISKYESEAEAKDMHNMSFSSISLAPLSLKVGVSIQGQIKSIESPSHKVKVEKAGYIGLPDNPIWDKAVVELTGKTTDMDRDFVVKILSKQIHKPRLYSEKLENGSTAAMLNLVPSFKFDNLKVEILFLLDRSGSMKGEGIELARNALLLFLHSVPADCYFNIVGFGRTVQFLFANSEKYDYSTLMKAVNHVKRVEADLGGTEILEPLKEIYMRPGIRGYFTQIFILTDGDVSNTDHIFAAARANAHRARIFALGIGDAASHHFVEGFAAAGGGTSAFLSTTEKIKKKVLNQLKNGLQPSLTEIELEWEGVERSEPLSSGKTEDKAGPMMNNKQRATLGCIKPFMQEVKEDGEEDESKYTQSPKRIPCVFDGAQLLVFGVFKSVMPTAVTIKAQSPYGPLSVRVELSAESEAGYTGMLHRLAAIKQVRELELEVGAIPYQECLSEDYEERLKQEIISISCENGICSKYTSFVIVDANAGDKPLNENWAVMMERRHVASQFAKGWHGRGSRRHVQQPRAWWHSVACSEVPDCSFLILKQAGLGGGCTGFADPHKRLSLSTGPIRRSETRKELLRLELLSRSRECEINEEEEEESADKLMRLQCFDGSYLMDDNLCHILGKNLEKLRMEACEKNLEEKVLATALAIAYFTSKPGGQNYDLYVLKAKNWLASQVGDEEIDELMSSSENLLQSQTEEKDKCRKSDNQVWLHWKNSPI